MMRRRYALVEHDGRIKSAVLSAELQNGDFVGTFYGDDVLILPRRIAANKVVARWRRIPYVWQVKLALVAWRAWGRRQ
jgi:hypothetical protein